MSRRWPLSEVAACRALAVVWLETGASTDPHQDCPAAATALLDDAEEAMCVLPLAWLVGPIIGAGLALEDIRETGDGLVPWRLGLVAVKPEPPTSHF